jgi:uncharacterized small protein (DUF1192 family)
MGASPKTKSDYRKLIAKKQGELAQAKAMKSKAPKSGLSYNKDYWSSVIASLQGEIARLKAEMADAPSK